MSLVKEARSWILVLKLTVYISIISSASGNNFRYHEYAIDPLGHIHRRIEAQKAILPFLNSKSFQEWTDQLSKRSLLNRANQINLNSSLLNSLNLTEPNPLSNFFQNILSGLSNNASQSNNPSQNNNSSSGLGGVLQNIFNNINSLTSSGGSRNTSNGPQTGTLSNIFGNLLKNITGNPDLIGNVLSSVLGSDGGSAAPSGVNFGDVLKLLSSGRLDPTSAGKALMLYLQATMQNTKASAGCQNDFIKVISGLQAREAWALKLLDASARIPTDLMNLDLNWYGSYEECYSDNTALEVFGLLHNAQTPVRGQYCNMNLNLPLPAEAKGVLMGFMQNSGYIRTGVCFPKSCSTEDLVKIVNAFLSNLPLGENKVSAWPITCPVPVEDDKLETEAIIVVVLLSVFLILILEGTLYDVLVTVRSKRSQEKEAETETEKPKLQENGSSPVEHNGYKLRVDNGNIQHPEAGKTHVQKQGILGRLAMCFSAYTNGQKILSTSQPKGSLSAINGIRFLSMTWVILGHTIAFVLGNTSNPITYYMKFTNRVSSQAIFNALFSVDTFFVLSGLLTSYLLLKQMSKTKGRINWGLFYFHRYWRLTPVYMILIGMYVTLYPHLVFGPNKPDPDQICIRSWWKNLLYIDNFFGTDDLCFGWSWYLNNDMQFYILSPCLIVPFYFNKIAGICVNIIFLLATTITPGVLSYVKNLPIHTIGGGPPNADRAAYFNDYYIVPYCRMGPYICGVVTGYILYKTKCKYRMNIFVNLLGWAIAAASASACLYGIYDSVKPDKPVTLSKEVTALYNAVSRTVWGAAVCWVIFACSTGNGGFINTLLSWKAFVPLSRLTYCAYLVHPLVMYVYYFNWNFPMYMTDLNYVFLFLANLMVSYGVAFVISIAFESPFMALEKILFQARGKKKQNRQ